MSDPLQTIRNAEELIKRRNQQRQSIQLDHRGGIAAETIADELTMIRAEMTVMRELLATIAAKR
jgi:hypothetical protein